MSTELNSSNKSVTLISFWGGEERGKCVALNITRQHHFRPMLESSIKTVNTDADRQEVIGTASEWAIEISLTKEQAEKLGKDLLNFASGELKPAFLGYGD